MYNRQNLTMALGMALLLSACVSPSVSSIQRSERLTAQTPQTASYPNTRTSGTNYRRNARADLATQPGLESVIGAKAEQLVRQFGTPRLDSLEGPARKMQFTGPACVLDIFLYPKQFGAEPVAAHVEARRASDGLDVNRAACVMALQQ
jgi:hypothetical protein